MSDTPDAPKRFDVLDSWRGLAALLVALLHYPAWQGWEGADNRRVWAIAVPFFFVLSAFVLSHSLQASSYKDFRSFALRRIARLYPLHIVTALAFLACSIAVSVAAALVLSLDGSPSDPVFHLVDYTPQSFLDQLMMVQFIGPTGMAWNPPAWSLSVELWVGLAMFVVMRAPASPIKALLLSGACVIVAGIYYADGGFLLRPSANLFGITWINSAILLAGYCFALGILAHDLRAANIPWMPRVAAVLEVPAVLAIVWSLFIAPDAGNEWALLPLAIVVFVFQWQAGPVSRLLTVKSLVALGTISYSVYLLHYPLLILLDAVGFVLENAAPEAFVVYRSTWLDKLVYVASLIWASHLTFTYFETPARKFILDTTTARSKARGAAG